MGKSFCTPKGNYKKAKRQQLSVGMRILKQLGLLREEVSPLDIKISVGRHTTDNLQTKTQAFSTLVATGELATIDALELSCLTNKSREVVERGEEAKKKRLEEAQKSVGNTQNNEHQDLGLLRTFQILPPPTLPP